VTPDQAIAQAKQGRLLPVYVVAGEERFVRDQVVSELRTASLAGGVAEFNEDRFTAGEVDVDTVISAARTVPMMARRRFVLVRGADRWDVDGTSTGATGRGRSLESA
jgi:DNA polymerase III subunit delta